MLVAISAPTKANPKAWVGSCYGKRYVGEGSCLVIDDLFWSEQPTQIKLFLVRMRQAMVETEKEKELEELVVGPRH